MSLLERIDQARFWRRAAPLWVCWLLCIPASAAALPISGPLPDSAAPAWHDAPQATVYPQHAAGDEVSATVAEGGQAEDEAVELDLEWAVPLGPLSQAPLCDPTGSSVMAPLPVLPSQHGEIQACWDQEWEADERVQPSGHDPPLRRFQALHDEATVGPLTLPLGTPEPSLLSRCKPTLHPAVGYARELERPPRG